jgi:two-component system chemotaxis response regulator CheB
MHAARDTVVIGTSAGGVDTLPRVLGALPRDFPAAVLVVQHMADTAEPMLASILERRAQLPVRWAEQGDPIEPAQVYVTPPGVHMMIVDDHLQLMASARENHVRPSIDRLFRSAAALRGGRTIGVLLTGMMDDGVAGLRAIQESGGYTIVQDPTDAEFPELPRRALEALQPDRVATANAIGALLVRLTDEAAQHSTATPPTIGVEARLDREDPRDPARMAELGPQTSIACPDCNGPTWLVTDPAPPRYRCYLGHVANARRVLDTGRDHVETAMWSAIRALHERSMTFDDLAANALRAGHSELHAVYRTKSELARNQAETARKFMVELANVRD